MVDQRKIDGYICEVIPYRTAFNCLMHGVLYLLALGGVEKMKVGFGRVHLLAQECGCD